MLKTIDPEARWTLTIDPVTYTLRPLPASAQIDIMGFADADGPRVTWDGARVVRICSLGLAGWDGLDVPFSAEAIERVPPAHLIMIAAALLDATKLGRVEKKD